MKIFIKNSMLAIFLSCCLFWATSAESKVCFAGDGDCGGIETFGGYQDPTNDIATQCAKAGYETLRSSCLPANGQQVTDYCPYDSNYVKCCSLDYQYDSCVYPLKQAGKCGNKYKCVCDPSKYKYTPETCKSSYQNSNAGGASCAEVSYNSSSRTTTTKILFTDCTCNEALYPYVPNDCKNGTAPTGDVCYGINVNGVRETKYASCLCNPDVYKYTTNYCDSPSNDRWGGDDSKKCIQGGITYFANCLRCGTSYPATSTAHVSGVACRYLSDVERTEELINYTRVVTINGVRYYKPTASATCGYAECPYGARYKILNCALGYKPGANGGNCQEMTCKETVEDYLSKNSSDASSFEIFTGSSSSLKPNQIVVDNITPTYVRKGKYYYSGYAFGALRSSDVIKQRCASKAMPVITWNYGNFDAPNNGQLSGYITFYNVGLDFTTKMTTDMAFNCYNCKINLRNDLVLGGTTTFQYLSSYYNGDTMPSLAVTSKTSFSSSTLTSGNEILINAYFNSTGYDYDVNRFAVVAPLTTSVFLKGNSSSDRMNFKTNQFVAQGTMGFNYANIRSRLSCIGCGMDRNGNSGEGGVLYSSVNLYNSDWYMYGTDGTYFTVRILGACFLGNAFGDGLAPTSQTSNIKYQDGSNYAYIAQPIQYSSCGRCGRGYVMSSTGGITNIGASGNGCARWCQTARKPSQYNNNKVCACSGKKDFYGVAGGEDGWLLCGFRGGRC